MAKIGRNANTRSGGQPSPAAFREVVGNPRGSREERRAWRKLQKPGHQVDAVFETRDPDPEPESE